MLLNNLFEALTRTGSGKTAVIGWGRGMGHKGHMMLASSVITKAKEVNGDPYFVLSKTVGKDDPITPDEKLAIYKKVFPQSGHIFQVATDEMPDLTRVLTNLNQQGYTSAVIVVGEDQKAAFQYLNKYNGQPDKSGNIPFKFNSLNVISRQETGDPSAGEAGPRATPMRQVLTDPAKSDQEQFAVWRDAMSPELSDEEVRDLMLKAKQRMQPVPKVKKAVAEAVKQRLDPKCWTGKHKEGTKIKGGVRVNNCVANEGAPIVVMPMVPRPKKAEPTKVRYRGDIVPPTQPPSTEKRGVKGRPGQRPMPTYDEGIAEGIICPYCEADPCICDDSHGFVKEEFNGEYDDEAGMAQSNLHTLARTVNGLLKTIKDDDNLPEWSQEKIAKAEMMLVSVWDYLLSQKAMGTDPKVNMSEATSAAIRLQRAIERQRAKSDASLRRTPSSIPKPEPKKKVETMLSPSSFVGSDKNKLGKAGQLRGNAPKEQPTHKLVGEELVDEHIVKVGGHYELKSKSSGKTLGKGSKEEMKKREREVQYFKHAKESKNNKCVPIGEAYELVMMQAISKLFEGKK